MRIFLLFLLFFVTIDIYRRFNASTHLFHCRQLQAPKRLRLMDNEQFRCIFPTHYKNTQRARQQQQQQLKCETETESIKGKDRSRNKEREPKTEGKRNYDLASSAHEAKLMQPGDEKLQLAAARSYTHTLAHRHTSTPSLSLTYTTFQCVLNTLTLAVALSLTLSVSFGAQANSTKCSDQKQQHCERVAIAFCLPLLLAGRAAHNWAPDANVTEPQLRLGRSAAAAAAAAVESSDDASLSARTCDCNCYCMCIIGFNGLTGLLLLLLLLMPVLSCMRRWYSQRAHTLWKIL